MVAQDAKTCADIMKVSKELHFRNGMVVAVPNPSPVDQGVIDGAIEVINI